MIYHFKLHNFEKGEYRVCMMNLAGNNLAFVKKDVTLWRYYYLSNLNNMANREYINKNKNWLIDKSREDGVFTIVKGVSYKVISSGDVNGKQPSARSIVTAHYTGRTIDGKTFDSSVGGVPLAIRLSDVIEGWGVEMQKMHVGDKWEVYLSSDMGYGKFAQPGIPSCSTLIFEIELLAVG